MASERDALSRFNDMEEQVSSLKKNISRLEEECRSLEGKTKEKEVENQKLLKTVDAERERVERAEQREKERHRGPDSESMRKIRVKFCVNFLISHLTNSHLLGPGRDDLGTASKPRSHQTGGGGFVIGDGRNWTSFRRYARAEYETPSATPRER